MINLSHFRYARLPVGFGAAGSSAAASATDNTSKISSAMSTAVTGASSSSPFESTAQSAISASSTLAANAAIARINIERKAKSASLLKQIDGAQASINQASTAARLKAKYYVYTIPEVPLVDVDSVDVQV